jgi:CRP-like cAMP-binding protein
VLRPLTVICEAGDPWEHALFPVNGMLSLIAMTEDGATVEIAGVGREGMEGLPLLLRTAEAPYAVHVRVQTEVLRVRGSVLRAEVRTTPALYQVCLEYLHTLVRTVAQIALCHRFHPARQRLCRWMLGVLDRSDDHVLKLTQQVIGESLGISRTAVTAIAVELQDAGAIRCRHGRVAVLSRSRLEQLSCECYRVLFTGDVALAGSGV